MQRAHCRERVLEPLAGLRPGRKRRRLREALHIPQEETGTKVRIADSRRTAGLAACAGQHGKGRHDERVVLRHKAPEVRARHAVGEGVDDAVGARRNRHARAVAAADVHHGQFVSRMRRDNDSAQRRRVQRRHGYPELRSRFVDDLDVVGALPDARIDEGLRLRRVRKCGNRDPVLRAVAVWGRDKRTGREEIGAIRRRAGGLFSLHRAHRRQRREHVEVRHHAERQRALETRAGLTMRVRIDEAWKQRPSLAPDLDGAGRDRNRLTRQRDCGDPATFKHHGRRVDQLRPVEHPDIADDHRRRLRLLGWRIESGEEVG